MQISIIKPNNQDKNFKKRVVAYVRVSTLKEEQEESFESQVSYYEKLIKSNPKYTFVNIYTDLGISGLSLGKRKGFINMIYDAKKGNFDLILCKSISRFGRNSTEMQTHIRQLKSYGVEVIFQKEKLSTFNPMMEMILNFMSIIAQEESKSISENTVWSLNKQAEQGIRKLGNNRIFGYDEKNGILIPNSNAPIIKMIYKMYSKGAKISDIVSYLSNINVVGVRSKKPLKYSNISYILSNVIYKGDRIIQKKPHIDYLTKKPDNTKECTQYYVSNSHEAIISKELWYTCQLERERRKKKESSS